MAASSANKVNLGITVVAAKNLPKMKSAAYQFGDFTKKALGKKKGYIDAFVMTTFVDMPSRMKQSFRSPTVKENYNPKWDYSFDCTVETEDAQVKCEFEIHNQEGTENSRKGATGIFTFSASVAVNEHISVPLLLSSDVTAKKSDPPTLVIVLRRFDLRAAGAAGPPPLTSSLSFTASKSASQSMVLSSSSAGSSVMYEPTKERPSGFVSHRTSGNLDLTNSKHTLKSKPDAKVPLADWAQALRPELVNGTHTFTVLVKGGSKCLIGWAPPSFACKQDPQALPWNEGYFLNLYEGLALGNPLAEKVKGQGPDADPDWGLGPVEPNEVFTIKSQVNTLTNTVSFSMNGAPFDVIFAQVSTLNPLIPTFGFYGHEEPNLELTLPQL